MRKFIIPVIALAAASVAAPTMAQSRHDPHHRAPAYHQAPHRASPVVRWHSIETRKLQFESNLRQGVRMGRLSNREANRFRGRVNELVRMERHYSRNGLSQLERNELDRRFYSLSADLNTKLAPPRGGPRRH